MRNYNFTQAEEEALRMLRVNHYDEYESLLRLAEREIKEYGGVLK